MITEAHYPAKETPYLAALTWHEQAGFHRKREPTAKKKQLPERTLNSKHSVAGTSSEWHDTIGTQRASATNGPIAAYNKHSARDVH